MSTTTTERTRAARQPTPVSSPRDPGGAVGRAYARRAGRRRRMGGAGAEDTEGRSQFVLMIMVMLGVGLVASLWLSTSAAADSYGLNAARQSTRDLSERIEVVHSQIDAMQSPPAIARAAASLGMVQVADVARLIVEPDGHVTVFGTPKVAVGAPAPAAQGSAPAQTPSPTDRMTPEQLVALQAEQPQPTSAQPVLSAASARALVGTGR
jgi:hypothetical protein